MKNAGTIDARRIEEAGLNALQTQRQLFYDGWLLKLSAGKAKRARSVNAFFGSTLSLPRKIEHCEKIYAQHGLAPLFRMTPFNCPADLEDALAARGYLAFDTTLVQAMKMDEAPAIPAAADDVDIAALEAAAFVETVGELRGSTVAQREAHREEDALGNGYATLACASLLSWAWQHGANVAYLQVTADNAPAISIYRKFGFATIYSYHYRGPPGFCE